MNDWHKRLKADFILANPPFNYHPWNQERLLDIGSFGKGKVAVDTLNHCLLLDSEKRKELYEKR